MDSRIRHLVEAILRVNSGEPKLDGSFGAWVGSGGAGDYTATKYIAYVVPRGASASCQQGYDGLPFDLESEAVARTYFERPDPQRPLLSFRGQNWEVTDNQALALYRDLAGFRVITPAWTAMAICTSVSPTTVEPGIVHKSLFRPQPQQGQTVQQAFGYGTYKFFIASAVDNLDPNVGFGLFTWHDDPAYAPYQSGSLFQAFSPWVNDPYADSPGAGIIPSHSELDVEFSRWGILNGPNAQFVVQPYTNPGARYQFQMPSGYNQYVAIINWFPDGITFEVQDPNGVQLAQYSYPGPVPPPGDNGGWPGPVPSFQQVRFNLWLVNGNPPTNGQSAEVVMSNFSYVPYNR